MGGGFVVAVVGAGLGMMLAAGARRKPLDPRRACVDRVVALALRAAEDKAHTFAGDAPKASNPSFQPVVDCLEKARKSGRPFRECAGVLRAVVERELDAGRVEGVVTSLRNTGVPEPDLACLREVARPLERRRGRT